MPSAPTSPSPLPLETFTACKKSTIYCATSPLNWSQSYDRYKAPDGGNKVKLTPEILGKHQEKIAAELKKISKPVRSSKPTFLVMHGGSGSEK
eukprot:431748-Amorphochlora_amoeboformis.AAC.3